MPQVSVIIVSWNKKDLLKECLTSLCLQTFKDFEVIVVDNASTDGTGQMVKSDFPQFKLIVLTNNEGFTGGNIAGFKVAAGEFITILNNDTKVSALWLESLISPMLEDSNVGICSSKVIVEGTDIIDSAGGGLTTAFSGYKIGLNQKADLFNEQGPVLGGYACACAYRREMINEIGFLDEDFIFNHEDTDLDLRAYFMGWKCVFVPTALVEHKVSASLGHVSSPSVYYFARNSELLWIKDIPWKDMIYYLPDRLLYELFSFCYFCIIHKRWGAFFKGKLDALKLMPRFLKKRKLVQAKIKIKNAKNQTRLEPFSKYIFSRLKNYKK